MVEYKIPGLFNADWRVYTDENFQQVCMYFNAAAADSLALLDMFTGSSLSRSYLLGGETLESPMLTQQIDILPHTQ